MTTPERHRRASEIFLEIRELPAERRAAALAETTDGDAWLRREVESLLEHDGTVGADAPAATDVLPERIGPYRVVAPLGRGGSGRVLLAEQDEPVRRRVAVKLVPSAATSAELAARFDVERRALECTEHPNIARILDTGRTEEGIPYLVMDLVEGPPITRYCEEHALSLVERLELLLPVADALQHAHQRGVVHRDVKPANVLVAERDGAPVPTVLDFGIAKPVAGAIAGESPDTLGLPLGTPSYMAPEQTGVGSIDVRADVYALGALAYELVTGAPPLRREADVDPVELLRRIREEVPPLASRAGAASSGAPRALVADLDAILARALEKDPERRYPSIGELAADLRRLLAREPIEARVPTVSYRVARFLERNRALAAAGALVVLSLAVAVVALAVGLERAEHHRAIAERERRVEEEIGRFLREDLLMAAAPDALGAEVRASDMLARASAAIDERFPDAPYVAARVHYALASAYAELGDYDAADRHAGRALERFAEGDALDSTHAIHAEILAADLVVRREDYAEGKRLFVPLVERARERLGPDDPQLYVALNDLGVALESLGELDEARAALEESLDGRRRLLEPHHRDVLTAMANLAYVQERQGDVEGSIERLREALALAGSSPEPARFTLLGLHNNLGATYQDLGRDAEAVPHLRRAAELADEALGDDHPATVGIQLNLAGLEAETGDPVRAIALYERVIAYRTELLGPEAEGTLAAQLGSWDAVRLAGRTAEAIAGLEGHLATVVAALGDTHRLAAQTSATLAQAYADAGRVDEARATGEEALRRIGEAFGPGHPRAAFVQQMLDTLPRDPAQEATTER